jgi:AbrB family looped-hinge helix DNA binding protein
MTSRVGPKGQVVLPKRVRDALGIRPGDRVVVEEAGDEARVRRADPHASLRGMLRAGDPLSDLEREHRHEIERDEARSRERSR